MTIMQFTNGSKTGAYLSGQRNSLTSLHLKFSQSPYVARLHRAKSLSGHGPGIVYYRNTMSYLKNITGPDTGLLALLLML